MFKSQKWKKKKKKLKGRKDGSIDIIIKLGTYTVCNFIRSTSKGQR